MRRYAAGALLFLLLSQSSGASALAATPGGISTLRFDFATVVEPLVSAIENSQLVAQLTGSGDRYAAMHAPSPHIAPATNHIDAAALIRSKHPLSPRVRPGVRRNVIMPPTSELNPRHHRLDALAMRRSTVLPKSATLPPSGAPLAALHSPLISQKARGAQPAQRRLIGTNPMISLLGGTGIQPWWTYEEHAIPGIGDALVNVGTGNLVVSAVDVDIPEQGIDLAFQRVYNSQSLHDYRGDDGGDGAIFGNRWTNNFDANIVYSQTTNTFTVYDLDGAACIYTSDGQGNWVPCVGEHATFAPTDANDCTYAWTKKDGTVFWFHADNSGGTGCNLPAAKKGHLQEIFDRNLNNNITFNYSYVPGAKEDSEDITEIDANHSDGQSLVMTFGLVPGTTVNELATITRPDGSLVRYSYDTSGNLLEVDRPGNDSASVLPETYAYAGGTSALQEACGPRCTISARQHPNGNPTDGSALLFTIDGSLHLTSWQVAGVMNIDPGDGYGIIQPWDQTHRGWENAAYTANFVYGTGNGCSNTLSGTTSMCDSDLHSTIWTSNGSGNVTETQESTGATEGIMLETTETWDSSNNLVATTDARGFETDYAYDSNGNTIAVARPRPVSGQDRPTSVYAYDGNNNLLAYCDPVYSAQNGLDWNSGTYNGTQCPGGPGTSHYVWKSPSDGSEPFGRIYQAFTACYNGSCADHFNGVSEPGNLVTYTYNSYGLPLTATGSTIQQPAPPPQDSRTPVLTFGYDSLGNLTSYSAGAGTWMLKYDGLNRLTQRIDPDTGNPTSHFYYNADGSTSLTETPYQHSVSNGNAFAHDADGDVLSETIHRNNVQGTISKSYDGLDRLVEVSQPYDNNHDVLTNNWITRYLYDLTEGGSNTFNGSTPFSAYGNLYATQELLPTNGTSETYKGSKVGNTTFQPLKGAQFDALDRAVGSYSIISSGNNSSNAVITTTYDGGGYYGLVSKQLKPGQLSATPKYDQDSRTTEIDYSDSKFLKYTYDAANHELTAQNGDGTQTRWYDAEGRVVNLQEPNRGTAPATYTHRLYADGKMKQLDVAPTSGNTGLNQTGLFVYSYQTDGKLSLQTISYAPKSIQTSVAYAYTPAGRLSGKTESGAGANSSPTSFSYDNFGQLSASWFPGESKIVNYSYDPEGDLLTFGSSGTFSYTMRGELLGPPQGGGPYDTGGFQMANGAQVQTSKPGTTFSSVWDDRMGIMMNSATNPNFSNESSMAFSYDTAGRLTSDVGNNCDFGSCAQMALSTTNRSYDVQDHTTDTTQSYHDELLPNNSVANVSVYDWGPSGHPIRIGSADASPTYNPPPDSSATFDTLHWDGDQLIFSTNSGGTVDDIKIGSAGDITPLDKGYAGLTFWDRGPGGAVIYCHNAGGSSGPGVVAEYAIQMMYTSSPCASGFNNPPSSGFPTSIMWFNAADQSGKPKHGGFGVGQGEIVGMYRPDGITDGANTIQGVRTTDSNSGSWTTPDADVGVVGDPGTQKSYIWNNNNPVRYEDPSGNFSNQPPQSTPTFPEWGLSPEVSQWLDYLELLGNPQGQLKTIAIVVAHRIPPPQAVTLQIDFTSRFFVGPHGQAVLACNGDIFAGFGAQAAAPPGGSVMVTANWLHPWNGPLNSASQAGILGKFSYGFAAAFGAAVSATGNSTGWNLGLGGGTQSAGFEFSYNLGPFHTSLPKWGGCK
jgi:YD repeat-containing protein